MWGGLDYDNEVMCDVLLLLNTLHTVIHLLLLRWGLGPERQIFFVHTTLAHSTSAILSDTCEVGLDTNRYQGYLSALKISSHYEPLSCQRLTYLQ